MPSERSRVVLIFAAVAVVTGGAGFYFVKIYRPKQMRQDAQTEIAAWESRWKAARDCLLGPSPASSRTAESLAIHELEPRPIPTERAPGARPTVEFRYGGTARAAPAPNCASSIGKLTRGEAEDTGITAVEAAWDNLDGAATKTAAAFAAHASSSTSAADDQLPIALDALDAARAELRAAADLPPPDETGKPLEAAQLLPIQDGTDAVIELYQEQSPSAHGVVAFGKTASHTVQITLTTGGTPRVGRLGPGTRRSVSDQAWGATGVGGTLRAGAFDVEGAIAAATELKAMPPEVIAVIGTAADGEIVAAQGEQLAIARAHTGAVANDAPIKVSSARAATDLDGRVALVYEDEPGKKTHARILKVGGDEPDLELAPEDHPTQLCLTADRAWGAAPDSMIAFGGGKPRVRANAMMGDLLGCTADAALLDAGGELLVCTTECRAAVSPAGGWTASLTVLDGKLAAVVAHGNVIGVWRDGVPHAYFALPQHIRFVLKHGVPVMAMTDGKVIDVLAQAGEKLVIVRIPVTPRS